MWDGITYPFINLYIYQRQRSSGLTADTGISVSIGLGRLCKLNKYLQRKILVGDNMCMSCHDTRADQWLYSWERIVGSIHDWWARLPYVPLQWHHNERDCISNHWHLDCLLNRLFRRRSKNASKFRVTGLCERNSPVTGEFPAQRASDVENVSVWWRHHAQRNIVVQQPTNV